MKKLLFALLLLSTFSFQSCFSYLNLTEAQSLGAGGNSFQIEMEANPVINKSGDLGLWASSELLYTRGITNSYDLGFYFNTNGVVGLHNKYHIFDREKTDFAVGLDVKYIFLSEGNFEITPTTYFTHDFGPVSLLANPALLIANDFTTSGQWSVNPNLTLGLQFGDIPFRVGYMIGTSQFQDISFAQAVGFSYQFKF